MRLAGVRLYLCTPRRADLAGFAAAVCQAGVGAVQLREKGLEARVELAALASLRAAVHDAGALLSVNDRADLAVLAGADILHLGQEDLTPRDARRLVGADCLLGLSTHTPAQIDRALADDDVDYYCVGPVFATPTKPGRPATGVALLRYAASVGGERKPWFAIGGLDEAGLTAAVAAGARRAVVVRALTEAADPAAAAQRLSRLLEGA